MAAGCFVRRAVGVVLIARLEVPGDRDVIGATMAFFRSLGRAPKEHVPRLLDRIGPQAWFARIPLLPQVIDTYVLASFIFWFVLLLTSFVFDFFMFLRFSNC